MNKILIVEDEFIIGFGIQHILEKNNYEVCGIYGKGEEAIQKALELNPDLILMDISLSGEIDGIEAADEIRKHLEVPIIFLTSYVDNITVSRAKKSEPFAYLVKPVDSKELLITLDMALYKSEMQQLIKDKDNWFKSVLKHLSDGVIATYNDFRIKFYNHSASEIFHDLNNMHFNNIFDLDLADNQGNTISSIDDFVFGQTTNLKYGKKFLEMTVSKIVNDKLESTGFVFVIKDVTLRIELENEKEQSLKELRKALKEVKRLSGLLPVCSYCKRIKNDSGEWQQAEDFFANNENVHISHGMCPDCLKKNYPDKAEKILNEK